VVEEQKGLSRNVVRGFAALGLGLLALLVILDALSPGGRGFLVVTPKNIDSICYFSTAHSLLFDRDLDLTNQLEVMIPPDTPLGPGSLNLVAVQKTGRPGSPYAIGYSLLGIPFLAAGTAIDSLTGGSGDGYGRWAERLFASANTVYLTIGLLVLYHWLVILGRRWNVGQRSVEGWAVLAAVALLSSTAVGYYAFTVMCHATSFMSVVLFLLVWWIRRDSLKLRDWLLVGVTVGFMTLCRWQNALFLIMVLVWELSKPGRLKKPAWWASRAAGAAACIALLMPQFVEWHAIYGTWLTMPQGSQYLIWPPVNIGRVLFSSLNGLFFTTPAVIVGVAGLLWGLRREPGFFGVLLVGMAVEVAFVGSIKKNWHGDAFAMRMLINTLPMVATGWMYIFMRARRSWRAGSLAWIAAGSAFTLLAAIQWRYQFVPRREPLTFEEAFTDKLKLGIAYQRYKAMLTAQNAAELEAVRQQFGESAVLMTRLKTAYDLEGRVEDSAEAASWLEKRKARALF
jgi:hypothetical protein